MALRPRADPSGWTPSLSRARAAPAPLWRSGRGGWEAGRLGAGRRRGRRKAVRDVAHVGIESVLVAGRGPAACAVVAACSHLDVKTVAVHSEADRNARHVRLAYDAILLGPAPAAESYLAVDRIVEAARRSGARAVLPVPPALAGNARLAGAVVAAGLTWVGPSAAVLERLGGDGVEPASERGFLALVTDGGLRCTTPVSRDRAAGIARVSWTPDEPFELPPAAKRLPEVGVPHDGAEACAVLERLASGSPASET